MFKLTQTSTPGNARTPGSAEENANHFLAHVRDRLLRGGRVIKYEGQAASCAPLVGGGVEAAPIIAHAPSPVSHLAALSARLGSGASAAAISAAVLIGMGATPAQAGTCTESAPGSGIWTCSGPAGADTAQTPTSAPGGDLTVTTASGFGITTAAGNAIDLNNAGADGNITFTGANGAMITGASSGIQAYNYGTGTLTVTSTETAAGAASSGINATNWSGTDLTINANNTSGGMSGIQAYNYGTGTLTVTSTGTAAGAASSGINATNWYGTGLTINANNTSGGMSGIRARNFGSGGVTIYLSGVARGGTGAAIDTFTGAGDPVLSNPSALTTINLAASSQALAGSSGVAIRNSGGNSVLNVASGAVINGAVMLGNGTDVANLAGTNTLAGITLLDGGDDSSSADGMIDTLSLNSVTATVNAGQIVNWEVVSFTNSMITASGLVTETVNVCGGSTTLGGASMVGQVLGCVSNDSLTLTGTTMVTGNIEGARGSDTINVLGGASVAGTIFGGGNGQDGSAAADTGDLIWVNTTGSVGAFDAGLGDDMVVLDSGAVTGNINGSEGSDQIGLNGGTVGGDVLGDSDDDRIVLNGTAVAGNIAGGDDNDMVVINAGSVGGDVLGGNGDDQIGLNGGAIAGNVYGDNIGGVADGNDTIVLTGTAVTGTVFSGAGDDSFTWTSGTTAGFIGGNGSDTANINSAAINLTGVVLDGGDDSSSADGMIDTLNVNAAGSGSLNGANTTNWEVINVNGGTVSFSNAAITAGVINVNGGGVLNASNNLVVAGNVAVNPGSWLVVGTSGGTGSARIAGNLINAGTVDSRSMTGASAAGDRLTVGGSYTGAAGSVVRFDAVLGASQASDLLVVNGNVGGLSTIAVNNVGGTGALTTGDGIRLVQVDGSSASGAFSLAGGAIDVGAFCYQLYNGGVANPNDQDWYLRSGVRDIVPPTTSTARVAQDAGLTSLGTLHERVGEQEHYGKAPSLEEGFLKGMWGRVLGSDYSETSKSAAFGDTRSNGQFGGLQMGVDFYRGVTDNGSRIHFGGYAGHLWSGTNDFTRTPVERGPVGKTRSGGWVAGGYLTSYTPSGFYVDAVVQGDWLDHRLNAVDGTSATTKSKGFLASLEMGRSFGSKWQFEPQVQMIYGNTSIDDFTDSAGTLNRIDIDDSWTGRAGFRLKRTWDYNPNSEGGLFTFYGKANIWGRLDGGTTTVTVGVSNPGTVQFKEVWGDVGVGTTFGIGKGAEFFADADVEFGIDQGATALSGRAGLRIRW